jgi:soluble lytic murein transglycosylase-like protein
MRKTSGALIVGMLILGAAMLAKKSRAWKDSPKAQPFLARLASAERKYGLPTDLLARIAYQESRWRDDIVTGALKSSAGAVGLMQIVPAYHPGVNPLDVSAAIDYAGKYIQQLYRQFGRWDLAVAAYNAGPGNVKKYAGIPPFRETQNYVREVFADLA